MPSLRTASRRQLTLFVAVSGVLVAAVAAVVLPVPYVILSPGPTLNTLGKGPGGRPLIQITGHPTYPTVGHLNLVTVSFQGGPSDSLNVFAALRAWLTPHEAVVPEEELFGPGQTQQQVVQQDTAADDQLAGDGDRGRAVCAGDQVPGGGHHRRGREGVSRARCAAAGRCHHGGGRQAGDLQGERGDR